MKAFAVSHGITAFTSRAADLLVFTRVRLRRRYKKKQLREVVRSVPQCRHRFPNSRKVPVYQPLIITSLSDSDFFHIFSLSRKITDKHERVGGKSDGVTHYSTDTGDVDHESYRYCQSNEKNNIDGLFSKVKSVFFY